MPVVVYLNIIFPSILSFTLTHHTFPGQDMSMSTLRIRIMELLSSIICNGMEILTNRVWQDP